MDDQCKLTPAPSASWWKRRLRHTYPAAQSLRSQLRGIMKASYALARNATDIALLAGTGWAGAQGRLTPGDGSAALNMSSGFESIGQRIIIFDRTQDFRTKTPEVPKCLVCILPQL